MKRINLVIYTIFLISSLFSLKSYAQSTTVRITDLQDFNGGTWSGQTGQINLTDDICIYSDDGLPVDSLGQYTVTASGSGAANRFRVANGPEFMNYTVRWNDVPGTTAGQLQLTKDVASVTQTTTEISGTDCTGGASPTAHIQIRFGNGQLRRNLPGTYTGTLTLLISAI